MDKEKTQTSEEKMEEKVNNGEKSDQNAASSSTSSDSNGNTPSSSNDESKGSKSGSNNKNGGNKSNDNGRNNNRGGFKKRFNSSGRGGGQIEPEHSVLTVRRVSRVVAGGRRFSFAAVVVVGDKKGTVGIGTGKASDTASAVAKAIAKARKNMQKIKLTNDHGIEHETQAKYCASHVFLSPSTGLIAGGTPRIVLTLAGVRNVNAKTLSRSKNHINNAHATIEALSTLV